MPLIDRTYFEGLLNIPHAGKVGDGVAESVNLAIADYEDRYLQAVLGASFYAVFMAGLAAGTGPYFSDEFSDEFLKSPLQPRWDWLVNGHTFTVNDRTVIWPGLADKRRSPIARFVWWYYRADNITTMQSTGGETLASYENATAVSPADKMARAWNEMVTLNRELNWILNESGVYPEFIQRELWCQPGSLNVYNYQNAVGL